MSFARSAAFVLILSAGATGCLGKTPKLPAPTPSLMVPAPPPRVWVPVALPPEPEPTPPAPTQTTTPRPTLPTSSLGRLPAATPTPTPTPTPPLEVTPTPTPIVPPASNATEVERAIRASLAATKTILDRVDLRPLGGDAKASYNTARSYLTRAEDALKIKNVEYAKELADKAEALAALLVKRTP